MKYFLRLFFILLTSTTSLITCNCNNGNGTQSQEEKLSLTMAKKVVQFTVEGMVCHSCTGVIKEALLRLPGVKSVEATLEPKENVRVFYDPKQISIKEIIAAINKTGRGEVVETKEL